MLARCVLALAAALLLVFASSAQAAFPGQNAKIAFAGPMGLWTMNADGTGPVQITSGADGSPAWSPDGTKLAFHRKRPGCTSEPCAYDIWIANDHGTDQALVIPTGAAPAWSPVGDQIVFTAGFPDGPVYRANTDGTNRTLLYNWEDADIFRIGRPSWAPDGSPVIMFHEGTLETICDPDLEECANLYPEHLYTASSQTFTPSPGGPGTRGAGPNWSPDGQQVTFYTPIPNAGFQLDELGGRIGTMNRDGTNRQLLTPGTPGGFEGPGFDKLPAWSPDGSRIVFERNGGGLHVIKTDGTGDTQLSTFGTDPDWQAFNPLPVRPKGASPFRVSLVPAAKACTSPNRQHGPPLAFPSCSPVQPESPNITVSQGDARLRSTGFVRMDVIVGAPGAPDDSDVQIRFSLTNVMNSSDFSDYTGTLTASTRVRLTDRAAGQGSTTATFDYSYPVPCAASTDTFLGSTCASNTSFDAIVPGSAPEGSRAIWALDRLQVYDDQESLFATQGVFVP